MSKIVFVPDISEVIKERIAPLGSLFAACANDNIHQFNQLAETIPDDYQWLRVSDEAFERLAVEMKSRDANSAIARLNKAYWLDLLRQLEAMVVMNIWRAADLGRSAVNQINRGDLGTGSIIARSSLENSAFLLHAARKVSTIAGELRNEDFSNNVIAGEEIEKFVVRAVFGSGKESNETEHEVAFNVLSAINSIEKIYVRNGSEGILEHYAALSEVVHPNFTGRALYVQCDEALTEPGHFRTTISRSPGQLNEHILTAAVAALSWAMATQVSASNLMSGCIKSVKTLVNDTAGS